MYIEIHEDSEHRRNARSRAQQIFSQALTGDGDHYRELCGEAPDAEVIAKFTMLTDLEGDD